MCADVKNHYLFFFKLWPERIFHLLLCGSEAAQSETTVMSAAKNSMTHPSARVSCEAAVAAMLV